MIITINDEVKKLGVSTRSMFEINKSEIKITLETERSNEPHDNAVSFLMGDFMSDSPFVVTLSDKALLKDEDIESWGTETINAYQMMRLAHVVSGEGRGEYLEIAKRIEGISDDEECEITASIGDSAISHYMIKGLCIYAMSFSTDDDVIAPLISSIRDKFESDVFSISSASGPDDRPMLSKIRSLSKRVALND